jgi:hypothetical protein
MRRPRVLGLVLIIGFDLLVFRLIPLQLWRGVFTIAGLLLGASLLHALAEVICDRMAARRLKQRGYRCSDKPMFRANGKDIY